MTDFEQLKEICRMAAHERNACKPGFEALMRTESIADIMQVWRDNWDDIFRSRYADIMVQQLQQISPSLINAFAQGGVYVNRDIDNGYVIISNPQREVHVGGTARAYVFTDAQVVATGNAQVYCRAAATITLQGHAYCMCEHKQAQVSIHNFAKAQGVMQAQCYNAAQVIITGGTLTDYGHRRIAAYGTSKIYSNTTRHIELDGDSCILELNESKPHE